MAEFRDETRPRVLSAVEVILGEADGLLDPGLVGRVAEQSSVAQEVIVQRWRSGASVLTDYVSENALATPRFAERVQGETPRAVLGALVDVLTQELPDNLVTRAGLAQAIASPTVRSVWLDFVREDLEHWSEAVSRAAVGPRDPVDLDRAAQAVAVVAGLCYSRMVVGEAATTVPDDRIVDLALATLTGGGA